MLSIIVVVRAAVRDHLCPAGEPSSSTADRGPWRCAGVTNGWWDVGPLSPAIREARAPHRLRTRTAGAPPSKEPIMKVFCGIDWAEDHHDVALVDAEGNIVGKRRISDDAAGFTLLVQLLAEAG